MRTSLKANTNTDKARTRNVADVKGKAFHRSQAGVAPSHVRIVGSGRKGGRRRATRSHRTHIYKEAWGRITGLLRMDARTTERQTSGCVPPSADAERTVPPVLVAKTRSIVML